MLDMRIIHIMLNNLCIIATVLKSSSFSKPPCGTPHLIPVLRATATHPSRRFIKAATSLRKLYDVDDFYIFLICS
jgi:hypothetical protein